MLMISARACLWALGVIKRMKLRHWSWKFYSQHSPSLIWSWSLGWISETHTSSWIFLLRLRQRTALNLGLFLVLCCHSHAFTNSLINLCSRNSLIMLSVASCFLQSGHVERQRDGAVSPVAVVHGFSDAFRFNWSSLKKNWFLLCVCM